MRRISSYYFDLLLDQKVKGQFYKDSQRSDTKCLITHEMLAIRSSNLLDMLPERSFKILHSKKVKGQGYEVTCVCRAMMPSCGVGPSVGSCILSKRSILSSNYFTVW